MGFHEKWRQWTLNVLLHGQGGDGNSLWPGWTMEFTGATADAGLLFDLGAGFAIFPRYHGDSMNRAFLGTDATRRTCRRNEAMEIIVCRCADFRLLLGLKGEWAYGPGRTNSAADMAFIPTIALREIEVGLADAADAIFQERWLQDMAMTTRNTEMAGRTILGEMDARYSPRRHYDIFLAVHGQRHRTKRLFGNGDGCSTGCDGPTCQQGSAADSRAVCPFLCRFAARIIRTDQRILRERGMLFFFTYVSSKRPLRPFSLYTRLYGWSSFCMILSRACMPMNSTGALSSVKTCVPWL